MGFLKNWCSLVVASPVVLFLVLLGPLPPPYDRGVQGGRPGPSESEDTDEAAALQKVVSRIRGNASEGEEEALGKARVRFIRNRDVLRELQRAPRHFPHALKGVYWLDQRGVYGYADIPGDFAFDDLAVTWGGPGVKFDRRRRMLEIPTCGATWTWFNSAHAYDVMAAARRARFGYTFYYNEDYTSSQIVPHLFTNLGKVELPVAIANFTMTQMPKPRPGQCPPKKGATRRERSACAACKRVSTFMGDSPLFRKFLGPPTTYHIFQIGDHSHRPTPYFAEYLKFADTTSAPDPKAFYESFGAEMPPAGYRKDVSLVFEDAPAP